MPDLAPGTREPWAKGWALSVSSVRWQEGLSCLSGRPWADHQVGGGGALGSRLSWRDLSRGGWCREAGMQKEISLLGPTRLSGLKFRGWERGRMGPFHLYPCLLPSLAFSLAFSQKFPDSLPAWILGFPPWVSSLAPPEHHPHPPRPTHSSWGFSFFAIRRRENADKVDSRCHGNRSPNYCVQPGSRAPGRGLGER